MINPKEALAVGLIASEALMPKRVRDLEEFLRTHPDAWAMLEQALAAVGVSRREDAEDDIGFEQGAGPFQI